MKNQKEKFKLLLRRCFGERILRSLRDESQLFLIEPNSSWNSNQPEWIPIPLCLLLEGNLMNGIWKNRLFLPPTAPAGAPSLDKTSRTNKRKSNKKKKRKAKHATISQKHSKDLSFPISVFSRRNQSILLIS